MKIFADSRIFVFFLFLLIVSGEKIQGLSYDYSATAECLIKPQRAKYGGGIIVNPEFAHNLEGWTSFGQAAIREGKSEDGNRYIIAHSRTGSLDSISQRVQFEEGKLYSFSAWVQISEGQANVGVAFRNGKNETVLGGKVTALKGCWSLLKGGVFANFSGPVDILFESKRTTEIWVDSISLQPFTMQQWRSHQQKSIHKERKSKVRFQLNFANGTSMDGAVVSIKQTKPNFPFGCGINHNILHNVSYQSWFTSRFKYATFTNEMKWYSNEKIRGQEDYTVADAMLKFAKENDVHVRGHNIFWDNPRQQPEWVKNLTSEELQEAALRRLNSVVLRYAGQLIAWDVVNENLHFSFFEDKLGKNASAEFYKRAYLLDPNTRMFMNEYNTIEDSRDEHSNAGNYKKKLQDILSYPGNQQILAGIGLQGSFGSDQPNLVYMRSSLDILGSTGVPIWLTEVSIAQGSNQAQYFEQILREGYSHPSVKGIIMFAGPENAGFNHTTLADNDFKNTPLGDVVDKLIEEWKNPDIRMETDREGAIEISLFHGDYDITVENPVNNSSTTFSYKVSKDVTIGGVSVHIINV